MTEHTPYSIHALELGPMENFIYLIHDHASGRAAVVDPAWDVPEVLALAARRGMRITDILLTHSHHDHTGGLKYLLKYYDEHAMARKRVNDRAHGLPPVQKPLDTEDLDLARDVGLIEWEDDQRTTKPEAEAESNTSPTCQI